MPNWSYMLVNGAWYASLGIWVGAMLMLALGTPHLFKALPRAQAGDLAGAWIGVQYWLGGICAAVASACAVFRFRSMEVTLWQTAGWPSQKVVAAVRYGLLAFMIVSHLYRWGILDPEIHRIRALLPSLAGSPDEALARADFGALHRRSVVLMGLNLLSGLGVIFLS